MKNVIKTKRLLIRALEQNELEEKIKIETDEHLKAAFSQMLDGVKSHKENWFWYTLWTICDKKTLEEIGSIGFMGEPKTGKLKLDMA